MTTKEIITLLKEKQADFLKTKSFSKLPGIYAFFYIGDDFPLLGETVEKNQIIYIGKTESSQEKRDAKTHFTTGKTGNSTVRKSIGSLLCSKENLNPIPRNDSDYSEGRFSHFMFDELSEKVITDWMVNNLALSFYEYPESKKMIDKLESDIIEVLKPILNIDHKNPNNPFKDEIKQLRKNCATMAIINSGFKDKKIEKMDNGKLKTQGVSSGEATSGTIIINNITESDLKSRILRITVENKRIFPTEKTGYPTTYHLHFSAGSIDFVAEYRIGSKDGKSRSGVLKLGDNIYLETLKINEGTSLKISKSKDNKYRIERM